jgi:hypothetical protein
MLSAQMFATPAALLGTTKPSYQQRKGIQIMKR